MPDLKGRYREPERGWQPTLKPADLGEIWDASRTIQSVDNSNANDERMRATYAPLLDAVNAQRRREGLPELQNPVYGVRTVDPRTANPDGGAYGQAAGVTVGQDAAQRDFFAELARIRRAHPDFLADAGNAPAPLMARAVEREKAARAAARETIDRGEGWDATITGFGGAAAKAFEDPVNFWGLAVGGGGARTLVGVMAREALVNGMMTAVTQPQAAVNRAIVGEELTLGEAATNVAAGAALGAGFAGAIRGGTKGLGKAWDGAMYGVYLSLPERLQAKWRGASVLPDEAIVEMAEATIGRGGFTPELRAASNVLSNAARIERATPFAGINGATAHGDRLAAALGDVRAGRPVSTRGQLTSGTTLARGDFGGRTAGRTTAEPGMAAYMRAVRGAESSNDDGAAASTTSAYGRYQFTRGTWLRYYVQAFGRQGLDDAAILAKRADGALQDRLMQQLTADNAAALRRAGHEPSAANLYMAHFAGPGDAMRVLGAADGVPVASLMRAESVAANPWLKDMTAGELRAKIAAKVGEGAPAGVRIAPVDRTAEFDAEIAAIDAEEAALTRGADAPRPSDAGDDGIETIVTARGRAVDTRFQVVEASSLIDSADARFDASLQPRDRAGRSASDVQVAKIAADLDPQQLGASRLASQGAPIVGADDLVESGNGRIAAIRRAYAEVPARAAEYRAMVEARDPAAAAMREPVLVRRRTSELTPDERRRWVREANERDTMQMSSPEQAAADAAAMSPATVAAFRGGELTDARNRAFVRAFLDEVVPPSEINALVDAAGAPSAEGLRRMNRALLARAYDAPDIVAEIAEAADTNIKAIGNALTRLAPAVAQLRDMIADGRIAPDYDLAGPLADLARRVRAARDAKMPIGDILKQRDMFGAGVDPETAALLRLFFRGQDLTAPRSIDKIVDALDEYIVAARQGPDFLGHQPTAEELIYAKRADVADDAEGRFAPTGGARPGDAGGGQPVGPGRTAGAGGDRGGPDGGDGGLADPTPTGDADTPVAFDDYDAVAPYLAEAPPASGFTAMDPDDAVWAALDRIEAEDAMARAGGAPEPHVADPALAAFDDPRGPGVQAHTDSLIHDARAMLAVEPEATVRLSDEGDAVSLASVLDEIDEEKAMIARMQSCL